MSVNLQLALAPERLEQGSAEECAAFGIFTIRSGEASLTEGFDYFLKGYRQGPLISGYHAAEWFAWNWWRLRWEPRSASDNWAFAHSMTSIGEGYAWPNITFFSDGVRTAIISSPSVRVDAKPFRYVGSLPFVVPSTMFESAVDDFIQQIISQIRAAGLTNTNLEKIWSDIISERRTPELAKRRKLEALLGRDPDEISEAEITQLISEYEQLGYLALEELAADNAQSGDVIQLPLPAKLAAVAHSKGYHISPKDMVRLGREYSIPHGADIPAWKIGAATAQYIRDKEHLDTTPLSNDLLARLAGTGVGTLDEVGVSGLNIAFTLDGPKSESRLVLRSKWETGRRFELARLLGDRLISPKGLLHPATRAHTYRQKMQRAFAAELLSPFEGVDEMLAGDFSTENQEEVAGRYEVSPMTIRTMLMNHNRISREEGSVDFDVSAA